MEKITVEHLNTYFGDAHILKDINFKTFLRSINRMNDLIPAFKCDGTLLLDDEDVYAPEMDVVDLRRKVGMVFQKPNPFPKSIFENVAYGLRIHGEEDEDFIKQRVEESLKSAAIWDEVKDKLDKSAMGLSGGQQQRLCIAGQSAEGKRTQRNDAAGVCE